MSDQEAIDADVRLIILKELADQPAHQVNETIITGTLEQFAYIKTREYVRAQLRSLEDLGAIRLRKMGSIMVAQLLRPGLEHLERRAFLEGVGRPSVEG